MRWPDDASLVRALRAGDEAAFAQLVDTHSGALIALAQSYVPTRALAEEVVQETWIGVIRGIERFEARSSLKTWVYRILVNIAKTRGRQERRTVPFSSAVGADEAAAGELVEADRFLGADHRWAGHWAAPPERWDVPDSALLKGERRDRILRAMQELPPAQREVLMLRDVQGWDSAEVCEALAISQENQRVLLHRARTKVRGAVEAELGSDVGAAV